MFGLASGPDESMLSQKGIGISIAIPRFKVALKGHYLCDQSHHYWVFNDGQSTHAARKDPKKFQRWVARGIKATINDYRQSPSTNRDMPSHLEVNPHKLVYNRVPGMWSQADGIAFSYPRRLRWMT